MACLYPWKIKVKAENKNSRWHNEWFPVRCNHCVNCIDERIREWTYRIMAECQSYSKMSFITLTYDDDHLPKNGSCSVSDVQKFIKRVRRYYEYNGEKLDISYYGATEYGGSSGRCHAHILFLGLDYNDFLPKDKKIASHNTINCTSRFWKNGLLNYGTDVTVTDSRIIRYVTKYIDKIDSDNLYKFCDIMGIEKPKVFHSNGIGSVYLNGCLSYDGELPRINGLKVKLPPYWRKKLDISSNENDYSLAMSYLEKQKNKRAELMRGLVDSNENYADIVTRCKRGIK